MLPPTLVKVTIVYGSTERAHPFASRADDLADAPLAAHLAGEGEPHLRHLSEHVPLGQVLDGVLFGGFRLITVRVWDAVLANVLLGAHYDEQGNEITTSIRGCD